MHETTAQIPETTTLLMEALDAHQRGGQAAVDAWAASPNVAARVERLPCETCEREQPHIYGGYCAVCWGLAEAAKERFWRELERSTGRSHREVADGR